MDRTAVGRWLRAALAAAGALGVLGVACVPEPTPGTVDLAGDSLTIQAFFNGGFGEDAPPDLQVFANNGWTAAHAQPYVSENVKNGRPEVLVVALGTNDASPYRGGWDIGDYARLQTLINTPHRDTCVVVVTPGYGPTLSSTHKTAIDRARVDLRRLISERPRTVEADWHAVVRDHPEYIVSDGIHLSGAEAWHARSALYWEGVAKCAALPPPSTSSTASSSSSSSSSTSAPTVPPSTSTSSSSTSSTSSPPSSSSSSSSTTTSAPPEPPPTNGSSTSSPTSTSSPPAATDLEERQRAR